MPGVAAVANQVAFDELGERPVAVRAGKGRELAFVDNAQLKGVVTLGNREFDAE